MKPLIPIAVLGIAAASFGLSVAFAQAPAPVQAPFAVPPYKNLRIIGHDIGRADLLDMMKSFSQSLGVRCTHCHVGEEGKPLSTFDFASEAKEKKLIARKMLAMVHRINDEDLGLFESAEPMVTCYTCHRGSTKPLTAPTPAATAPATPQPPKNERG